MFVRKKSFTNRDGSKRVYAQICHSRRVDGVSKHDVLFDLGRIDLPEGKAKLNEVVKILVNASEDISFLDVMKDLKAHDALEYVYRKVSQARSYPFTQPTIFLTYGLHVHFTSLSR